jgi:hypothetical protein
MIVAADWRECICDIECPRIRTARKLSRPGPLGLKSVPHSGERRRRTSDAVQHRSAYEPDAVAGRDRGDGRIAVMVLRPDSWSDEPGILDPVTGKVIGNVVNLLEEANENEGRRYFNPDLNTLPSLS